MNETQILVKKYHGTACFFCGSADRELIHFKSKLICGSCQFEMLYLNGEAAAAAESVADPAESGKKETSRSRKIDEMTRKLNELIMKHPKAKQIELAKMLNVSQS